VSRDFPYRGLGHRRTEGEVLQLRERRSGEKTRSRPSEEDRWQRSKDLANSEVRRVRAQTLGAPSREDARSEKKNSHWIWVIGGPLDREPHRLSRIRGFGG
jgi:hypothetical protein